MRRREKWGEEEKKWVWGVYCGDRCFNHPKNFFAPVES
jgi:hypothetical protein